LNQASLENQGRSFLWLPSFVGGMAGIGAAALFGTLVTNLGLWLAWARGLTVQEAYANFGKFDLSSPTELLSLGVVVLSGVLGGYAAAAYGGGRHYRQSLVAGLVGTTFYLVMSFSPTARLPPAWYLALSLGTTVLASLTGGHVYARRSA
jgi:hypothetical protein